MWRAIFRKKLFIAIMTAQFMIFAFDTTTRADDVSIGFLYTIPTLMGFLIIERGLQITIVVLSITLILTGCFFPVPIETDLLVFFANRVLSIITVLITGIMVNYRVRMEQTLGDALAKERKASAMQRAFVSMVSHEFRTPLTIIDGEAYRMGKVKQAVSPEDLQTRVKSIRQAVSRMIVLIERILYTSRAFDNKISMHLERVNLWTLLKSIGRQHSEVALSHQIKVNVHDLPVSIRADRNLVTYILDNLIGNAIKYSPEGSVVEVTGQTNGTMAVIAVRDQGIGIPEADLPNLFEPYYRGGNVAGISGSGVGLYLVETFVRMHGGRILVESVEGQGSVFTVQMPVAGAEPAPAVSTGESSFPDKQ
ncbi:MAG: hypothetical protein GC168_18735 [Candidatus Hydrogenedens sp.]|nr:hypothetical protein [Candidatus Hydrogenedens sp.]